MIFKEKAPKKLWGDSTIRVFQCEHSGEIFEINASKNGITVLGPSPLISTAEELDSFAEAIARAWQIHQKLLTDEIQNTTMETPTRGD